LKSVAAIAEIRTTVWRLQETERHKRRLAQACKDIVAFYRLEEQYTQALATQDRSADAVKREMRR
jgi:hypothetical protein